MNHPSKCCIGYRRLPPVLIAWLVAATSMLAQSQRQVVLDEIARRPDEPWPRSAGHVILATPGSTEDAKAYHEPGGSFSPAFGSFGVSIRIMDDSGKTLATSDTLPLGDIRQRFAPATGRNIPAVQTGNRFYRCEWENKKNRWDLHVNASTGHVALVIRSVGPAGGPLLTPRWNGKQLLLNDRWRIHPKPGLLSIVIDQELDAESPRRWELLKGKFRAIGEASEKSELPGSWGRATLRFETDAGLSIEDLEAPPPPTLPFRRIGTAIEFQVPDSTFSDAMEAQAAHLLMGLVGNGTRPGDPNNYPLEWLRDGAYSVVALARAGHLETARALLVPFLTHDFFGGFGAEADGPGLSLWAITEVASMLKDPKLDQQCWPAVERKVALITEMLEATGPVVKPWHGPLVPNKAEKMRPELVCDPAQDGLIWGKMDGHKPVLYVNAVTFTGWRGAAALARRIQKEVQASDWESRADQLRTAWNKAAHREDLANDRNAIASLHPSWIVTDRPAYREYLAARWRKSHDFTEQPVDPPVWTYFHVAEAHQWLCIGEPLRTWSTFRWFLEHQTSPGLYSWWEGKGEENTFRRWEKVRGWFRPPNVTPHYWTAAEMLLLQLAMLAYIDESGAVPKLIIGAGVPDEWLGETISLTSLPTKWGPVGWRWDSGKFTVQARGFPGEIIPSGPFSGK